ncbi:MAG: acyltransferase [Burkholderiales bacterium]
MGIGSLRFVLSLLVIDAHYGFVQPHVQLAALGRFGIDGLAYVGSGGIAVSGFFVISGYLIALVLDRKYDRGGRGALAFYVSRALRIYPLYWLVFAAYWLALSGPPMDASRLTGNLLLIPYGIAGMAMDRNGPGLANLTETMLIGPSWTLCYDLVFYLLAPWLFMRKHTSWWIAGLSLAYFAVFIAVAPPLPPVWSQFFYETGPPYLFMFAAGALAYHYRRKLAWGPRAAAALAAALLWITYVPVGLTNLAVNHLLAGLLFAPLVVILAARRAATRTDRVLGDLTYATYLVHLPLLVVAQQFAWPYPRATAFALTYAVALLLLWTFELPLDRLRDRLYVAARQKGAGARASAGRTMPALLAGTVAVLVAVGLWNNAFRAGETVELRAHCEGERWRCAGATVEWRDAGSADFAPRLSRANRIVATIDLPAGVGSAWAGIVGDDGVFRAGIRRDGDRCHVEIADRDGVRRDPPGWTETCRARRLAVGFADDRVRVVVDSILPMTGVSSAGSLAVRASGEPGSAGSATARQVFVTRR